MPWSSDYRYAIVRANPFTAPSDWTLIPDGLYSYGSAPNLGAAGSGWADVTSTGIVLNEQVYIDSWAAEAFVDGSPTTGGCLVTVNGADPDELNPTPPTGVYPAGTTFDLYGAWPTAVTLEPIVQVGIDLDYTPPGPGGGGGADAGIYVGMIVLGGAVGIYRYNGENGPVGSGPGEWANGYEAAPWQGSLDGLRYTTGGFELRLVEAEVAGIYNWSVTPLFTYTTTTSRIGVALYDGVNDFQGIDSEHYVASGDTLTGNVYIPEGWSVAFLVGDDDTEITQEILAGSYWSFVP